MKILRSTFLLVALSVALFLQNGFAAGPVSYYGRLKASGNKLIGANTNAPVQVRGMSFFWSCLDWDDGKYAKFWTAATVDAMVDSWKVEILRAAMAADNNGSCGDYQNKKTQTIQNVKTVVDRAIERDIYVIIDWHSHKAHEQQTEAINFFVNEMSIYHNNPHVIFEIYNEPPDGDANQWATIKPYMQAVVSAIRNAGANNLILVGTPYFDQDPDIATSNPVTGQDLAYVLHFYAAQHKLDDEPTIGSWRLLGNNSKKFRTAATNALNAGYPLFVSEYGTVNADGGGGVSASESDKWHTFMDANKISSCNWSINNKAEGASAFITSFNIPTSGSDAAWANNNNMTESGKYTFAKLTSYASTAEWRNAPSSSSAGTGAGQSSSSELSSSSSDANTPIMLSQFVQSNSLTAMQNAVNLQVAGKNAVVQIFDLKGNAIRVLHFAQGNYIVRMADLPKGLYVVKAAFGSEKRVLKTVVR